jgi:rod shape-determining protein MreB and related proteins
MSLRLRNPLKMLRSNQIALEFGSGRCVMASPKGEMLLEEPTVIALENGPGTMLAAGTEAKTFLGKAPERIRVIRPVEAGVIQDFEAARQLLRHYVSLVLPDDGSRVSASVVVSQGVTSLEKRTFADCCKAAGIGHCDLIPAPLAAAAGAGLDIRQPKGLLLLGIGHGLAEASVLCLADVVQSETSTCAAQSFHEAVSQHLAGRHQVGIGENMAEQATIRLAWATRPDSPRSMTLTGKYTTNGTPCALELTDDDLEHALDVPLAELETLVRRVMEKTPAELVADIAETGLSLYGGGAQLAGLDRYLGQRLGLRTRVVAEPSRAAVRGAAATLRPDLDFRRLLVR